MTHDKDPIDRTHSESDGQPGPSREAQDLAGLFSRANLGETKYRDFSQSREKARATSRRQRPQAEAAPVVGRSTASQPSRMGTHKAPPALTVASQAGPQRLPLPLRKAQRTTAEASRWSALNGIFGNLGAPPGKGPLPSIKLDAPTLALVSLAGGVGKTSLAASLGRSLAALGERVLLVDTQSYGVLPLYFGSRELGIGNTRSFELAPGSPPIVVMTIDPEGQPDRQFDRQIEAQEGEDRLAERIAGQANGASQVLIDVATGATALLREVLRLSPTVIVVLAPDMASMVSLRSLQAVFRDFGEETKQPVEAYFLLNRFDASLQLHLDIRNALSRQLGDRLLPFAVRSGSAMGEALAEGMTVQEYAANAEIVEDLNRFSLWIGNLSRTAEATARPARRWRER